MVFKRLGIAATLSAALVTGCGGEAEKTASPSMLADTISAIAASYPGEIGVAVIINNSDTIAVNNTCGYPMMSVFKMHQAIAVCDFLDRRQISPDSIITVARDSLDPQTWSPMLTEHSEPTISLSARELMRYALIQSDNNASNLMFDRLVDVGATDSLIATLIPRNTFQIAYTEKEMSADHNKAYSNHTSPLGAAMLINRLFTDSILTPESREFIRRTLGECLTGTDRISAPLIGKEGVTIAHKTGSGYSENGVLAAHNDVAFITLPNGTTYSLAVFVKDFHGTEAEASAAIARISDIIQRQLGLVPSIVAKESKAEYIRALIDSREQDNSVIIQDVMMAQHVANLETRILQYQHTALTIANDTVKNTDTISRLLSIIKVHPDYTYEEYARELGVSRATIARNIKKLNGAKIRRIGSDKNGCWELIG